MQIAETFWLVLIIGSVGGLTIGYILYPLLLVLLLPKRASLIPSGLTASVTLIIPAWAEKELEVKIDETQALDQIGIDLQVIVITDQASPTNLPPNFTWIQETARRGKSASINQAMKSVRTPLVVFSDANTRLHPSSLVHLLAPFQDPRVGAVAGEKQVRSVRSTAAGEEVYWKYESLLKRMDASLHSVISGAGELFAMRTLLFEDLPNDAVLDDLEMSWQVIRKGHRIAYAPAAIATEAPSKNLKEEAKRKIRMAAGAYQFLSRHSILDFFKVSAVFGCHFLFRKWFRWVLAPMLLCLVASVSIGLLFVVPRSALSTGLLRAEAVFFGLAMLGWVLHSFQLRIGWLTAPFYFVFMHLCQLRGWIRYCFGKQPATWEKSARSSLR